MKPSKKRANFLKKMEKKRLFRKIIMFLRRIKKRLVQRQGIYTSKKYSSIYFPINKVACTSIGDVLKRKGFERKNCNNISINNYKNRFTFIRNPYDRLVSAYKDKIEMPAESGVIAENPDKLYPGMSFKNFVRAVYSISDERADKHFKSQNSFLTDKEKRLIPDTIGKFENLEKDYKKIMKKIGIKKPPKLPHKRKSKRKKNYLEYYDEEIKKLVQERYKKDFELFGYEF